MKMATAGGKVYWSSVCELHLRRSEGSLMTMVATLRDDVGDSATRAAARTGHYLFLARSTRVASLLRQVRLRMLLVDASMADGSRSDSQQVGPVRVG